MQTKDLINDAYRLIAIQSEKNKELDNDSKELDEWLTFYENLSKDYKESINTQLEFVQNINE